MDPHFAQRPEHSVSSAFDVDESVYEIRLNAMECVYLLDSIHNGDVDEGDPERANVEEPIARHLVEKLASVYIDLIPSEPTQATLSQVVKDNRRESIYVTRKEAWLMREVTDFAAFGWDNKTPVGPGLLHSILSAIIIDDSSGWGEPSPDDRSLSDTQKTNLTNLMGGPDAGSANQDTDQNDT